MTNKTFQFKYTEGTDWQELNKTQKSTIQAAIDAAQQAYAPYSNFHVGAALMTSEGDILTGNNQENAAYPLCNCAEQIVLQKGFSDHPNLKIDLFAVYAASGSSQGPAAPCGACRQVLSESVTRSGQPFPIFLVDKDGSYYYFDSVLDLLPFHFDGSFLK